MNIEYLEVINSEEINENLEFLEKVFGKDERDMFQEIFFNSLNRNNNIIFAGKHNNKIISTITLIDFPINYFGIIIKSAELGLVATDESYRGKGINSVITDIYHKRLNEENYLISVIEGIPYYYRKFGYNYSVKMGGEKLELKNLETKKDDSVNLVPALKTDLEYIFETFVKTNKGIYSHKNKEIFETQAFIYNNKELKNNAYIIYENNIKTGYFLISDNGVVKDISDMSFNSYENILDFIKSNYKIDEVYADIPYNNKFISFLKTKNSINDQHYAWQIRIMDDFKFLETIKPVLENRLFNSIFKNEEFDFNYNNFKYLINIKIKNSKISFIKKIFAESWDFNLSPQGAVKLFFGHNSIEEINEFLPDCMVIKKYKELIDVMFPKTNAFFYQSY